MLLAVGPNPTIDRTLHVAELRMGAVHRATKVELAAGGKGPNVTRVGHILGYPTLATGPLGGHTGRLHAELMTRDGLPADWYWLDGVETRSTSLLNHPSGDATVINEPGPTITPADWDGLARHVTHLAREARAVAFCGSVLPGVPDEALGELARSLVTEQRAVYVDSSGAALAAVLARPDGLCIKVNRAELAAGLGLEPDLLSNQRLLEAGQMLLARGAAWVVVTLGSAGAVAITPDGGWLAAAPEVQVVSTVGSGDSLLAGLAIARLTGREPQAALAFGVACGAANATTSLPGRFERQTVEILLDQVRLTRL